MLPDGRFAVDVAARCENELGARLAYCAIGVRSRRRLTTQWVASTPSVRDLPANEMTRFTLEATGPTVRSADRVFVYVYLDSDRGTIELGPSTVEPFALAGITAVAATCLWLLAGPAVAAAASLLGGVAGWQIIRVTSRPETPPLSWQWLVRFWPAAAIAAAVVIYELAGGDSDLANHAYGTSRSTPAVLATVVLLPLSGRVGEKPSDG